MVEIEGLDLIEQIVKEEELRRKIAKDIRKDKIKQLMAQGVERGMATIMVDVFTEYGIE